MLNAVLWENVQMNDGRLILDKFIFCGIFA